MRHSFSISELCHALGVSRSGYHAAATRPPSSRAESNSQLIAQMTSIHGDRHTRCYGSPRMTRELHSLGLSCTENRVARLMRSNGLRARPRKPFRPKTTRPDHAAHPSPNLLAKAPPPTAPGTHIVSDICQRPPALPCGLPAAGYLAPLGSYIPTHEGWLYLAIVLDLFSRSILGWKLSDSLHTEVVTGALRRAIDTGLVAPDALFHSDRGCQYSAASTRALLACYGLRQSMSAAGYCYDNAFAESAFASLKSELLDDRAPFASKAAAATAVFDYLQTFYNRKRRHSSLGYQSPQSFLDHYFQTPNPSLN
jgi:transposase InsO family protein